MITLIIDNYDSFTYNLFQYVSELNGQEAIVVKNDELALEQISGLDFDNILISPGPGHPSVPRDFGVCTEVLLRLNQPILGVCLGHQGIAHLFGGVVKRAREPRHGRLSKVRHCQTNLFQGIPSPFEVVRYHSLAADIEGAQDLVATAWTDDGVLMGLAHRARPLWGVQFHPESICTEHGHRILRNFRDLSHERLVEQRTMSTVRLSEPTPPVPRREPHWRVSWRALGRLLDPEAVFHSLYGEAENAFWLDSSLVKPGLSRFSFMGDASGPCSEVLLYSSAECRIRRNGPNGGDEVEESIFEYLARSSSSGLVGAHDLPLPFRGGYVGYLGYELKQECGGEAPHSSPYPDAAMVFADRFVAFDHEAGETWVVELTRTGDQKPTDWLERTVARLKMVQPSPAPPAGSCKTPVEFRLRDDRTTYIDNINRALEYIRAGESYEVCLTTQIEAEIELRGLTLYSVLRRTNPAPFASYIRVGGIEVISASPERFIMVDRTGRVEAKPIKGTAKRGATPEDDARIAAELCADEKSRSENLMIVDLLRNDLGHVCAVGSVAVPVLMNVETYATVHQLVSTVSGQLPPSGSPVECVRQAFPGGSMTGAPKIRTLEIIDTLEASPRGIYSGAIGYFGVDGVVDLNIVIRTVVMQDNRLSLGVGGAIVALSDPEAEFEEILLKARASIRAIVLAASGEWSEDRYRLIGAEPSGRPADHLDAVEEVVA